MNITKKWIDKHKPCQKAVDWFWVQDERDSVKILKKLIAENKLTWANWAIVRVMAEY